MSRAVAWGVHVSAILVGVTGLGYGWMVYFAEPADEFAVVNHPLQPDLQAWHILTAPALVFACGLLWRTHVWARIRSGFGTRRPTGLALAGLLGPMVASGYLVQVASSEVWRPVWVGTHVVSSCAWVGLYAAHHLGPRRRRPLPRPRPAEALR